jgi:hypothetical protein
MLEVLGFQGDGIEGIQEEEFELVENNQNGASTVL